MILHNELHVDHNKNPKIFYTIMSLSPYSQE